LGINFRRFASFEIIIFILNATYSVSRAASCLLKIETGNLKSISCRNAHKKIVRGAEILVDWEVGRTMEGWKPRSLGGGFGGRRESGKYLGHTGTACFRTI